MIKKVIFALMWAISYAVSVSAQSTEVFEGEIELETFENSSDYIKKTPTSIYFDGVHKIRIIVKGDKMHLIDETTKCHTIADAAFVDKVLQGATPTKGTSLKGLNASVYGIGATASGAYVHYCEYTKTGMDYTNNLYAMMTQLLRQQDWIYIDGTTASLSANTFAETTTTKEILGMNCKLYEGDINHSMEGVMDTKCHVKAYVSDLPAPAGLKCAFYGLDVPGVPTQFVMKYDGGHVSTMSIGELSYYIEMNVTKITPRQVSDDEFIVPSNYKITNKLIASFKYFKSIKKELEKRGVKEFDKNENSTGVHYKTDEEWDY